MITRREGGISRNQMSWLIAEVAADSSPVLLEPGVFVEAEIEGRQLKQALALPRSALQKDQTVWLVDESGKLQQRTIEPVHSDRQHIYLTGGLAAGERVLLRGSEMLGEGMQVDVREVDVQPVYRPRPVVTNGSGALTVGLIDWFIDRPAVANLLAFCCWRAVFLHSTTPVRKRSPTCPWSALVSYPSCLRRRPRKLSSGCAIHWKPRSQPWKA